MVDAETTAARPSRWSAEEAIVIELNTNRE
jgi:hypothetical protein